MTQSTASKHLDELFSARIVNMLMILCFLEGLVFVFYGRLNADEGWYLYASQLVYQGQLPYRDFAYFQAPLLPYIYGIPQALVGQSMFIGRLTSLLFYFAIIYFARKLAHKLGGKTASVFTLLILFSVTRTVWALTNVRTEPLVSALVMMSLYFLWVEDGQPYASILSASAILWASAVRISCLPAFLLILTIALWRLSSPLQKLICSLAVGLQGVLFSLPFLFAPDKAIFNVFRAQTLLRAQSESGLVERTLIYEVLDRVYRFLDVANYSIFMVAAISFAILWLFWYSRRRETFHTENLFNRLGSLAVTVLVLYLPNLVAPRTHSAWTHWEHFVPSFTLLAPLIGCALATLYRSLKEQLARRFVVSVFLSMFVVQGLSSASGLPLLADVHDPDLLELRVVAAEMQDLVPRDQLLITFDTYLAVEADRYIAPGLEMNSFSYFPRLSDSEAVKFGVMNRTRLADAIRSERSGAVLLTDYDLNVISPHRNIQDGELALSEYEILGLLPELRGRFHLADVVPKFGQWQDHLYILLRTDM